MHAYTNELLIGCIMTAATTFLHAIFIAIAGALFRPITPGRSFVTHAIRDPLLLVAALMWLMLAHLISIWGWGLLYLSLDAATTLEEGLFKSALAYTTLGHIEAGFPQEWLLMFGLSTSFLFSIGGKLRIGG